MNKEIKTRIVEKVVEIKAIIKKTNTPVAQLKNPVIKGWSDFTNSPTWGDFSKGGGDGWSDFSKVK